MGLYYSMLQWAYSNTNTESWLILVVHNNANWIKGLFFPDVPLLYSAQRPLKVRDKPWKSEFESTNRLLQLGCRIQFEKKVKGNLLLFSVFSSVNNGIWTVDP
jgi:hypothetical protein